GRVLAADHRDAVSLWDVSTGKMLPGSADPWLNVGRLRFTDQGKRLLGFAEQIIAWEAATGKELGRIANPTADASWALALSPDESLLAGRASDAKKLVIWDAKTGAEVRTIEGAWLSPALFTPDSRRLIGKGPEGMRVWDVKTGKAIYKLSS